MPNQRREVGTDTQVPVPWFEPPAGATDAGGTPHSVPTRPGRNATNFVPSSDLTHINPPRLRD